MPTLEARGPDGSEAQWRWGRRHTLNGGVEIAHEERGHEPAPGTGLRHRRAMTRSATHQTAGKSEDAVHLRNASTAGLMDH